MGERNRFEVIINAIKTGTPITNPRSRFEEIINALVGAGGSSVEVTTYYNIGDKVATITVDDVSKDIKVPIRQGVWSDDVVTETTVLLNYQNSVTYDYDTYGTIDGYPLVVFEADLRNYKVNMFVTGATIASGSFSIGTVSQSNAWYQCTYNAETHVIAVTNQMSGAPDITGIKVLDWEASVI